MTLSYSGPSIVPTTGDCTAKFKIQFTVSGGSTVVIAWGGHVASHLDWGSGNTIPTGSPYHMHASFPQESPIGSSFNVGSQNLQLASTAVATVPTVTTILHKTDNSVVDIGGSVPLGTTMHDRVVL